MPNFAVSPIKVEIKFFKQHHTMQLSFNKLILWPGLAWIPWQELFTSVKEGSIALQLDCNNVAPFGLGLVFRVPIVKVLLIWKQTLRCSQRATNEFPMRDRLSTIRRGHGKSKRLKYSFRSRNPPLDHFEPATPLLIIAPPYWLPQTCRTGGACEGKTSIYIYLVYI